jgi:hypothetical protein
MRSCNSRSAKPRGKASHFAKFITQAISEKLQRGNSEPQRPWMKSFGLLRDLKDETRKVNRIIREEFEQIDPEAWR